MRFTHEQEKIFRVCSEINPGEIVAITAAAGSGKTSSLVELAKRLRDKKILYLAYNQSIAAESVRKFPANTTISTVHSLAYRELKIKPSELKNGDYNSTEIVELFEVDYSLAAAALELINSFVNSDEKSIYSTNQDARLLALKIWQKMLDRKILITHSAYLKEFELQKNREIYDDYDVVMLDEAQDSNDVTLSIFFNFTGSKILVGDPHQAIYGFRGSVNAFDKFEADYNLVLSECFRCCPNIVKKANEVLHAFKQNPITITSRVVPLRKDEEQDRIKSRAVITRTNSKIIELLAESLKSDINYVLVKNPNEIFSLTLNIVHFLKGNLDKIDTTRYGFLLACKNEDGLKEKIENDGGIELSSAYRIAKRYGLGLFKIKNKAIDNFKNQKNLEDKIYLATAHSSKGLEFDYVELERDFPSISKLAREGKRIHSNIIEEVNLYYVAITRARYVLIDRTRNEEFGGKG